MFLSIKLNDDDDNTTRWLRFMINVCIYKYVYYTMILWDVIRTRWYYVVLRAPMDGLWQRSHMGKPWFIPPRLLWLVFSSERVVGVSAWCIIHVRHTRVNTSVGFVYIFSDFHDIKTIMYYVLKSMYYKRNTGGFWLRPGPMRFRECFRPPMSFQTKI